MTASLSPVLVAPVATFITVMLLVLSLATPRRNEARDKLRPYAYRNAQDPDSLGRPFTERVLFPVLERFGRFAGAAAPREMQERIKQALAEAGDPLSVNSYLAVRTIGTIGLPALYALLLLSAHTRFATSNLLVLIFLVVAGNYTPKRWLTSKANTRRKEIEHALPDALDLIVVSMEAGLALDGAIAKVVEKSKGALKDEFQRMLHEIQLGMPRREAMRQLGTRTKVKDMITLINSVVQADQMGVSMAQVMRTQADEARLKRRQRAEEKAHQAAVKMLFPLVLFILPSVMIVAVGPAALAIFHQFSSGGLGA
jgi:tight adherence protein C